MRGVDVAVALLGLGFAGCEDEPAAVIACEDSFDCPSDEPLCASRSARASA